MTTMRAKVRVSSVLAIKHEGETTSEEVKFNGVAKSESYPADGLDEDNTVAKFSPSVEMKLTIANPALFGKFSLGDTFYVDFKPAG